MMRNLTFVIAILFLGVSLGQPTTRIPKAELTTIPGDAGAAVRSLASAFAAIRTSTDSAEATSLREEVIAIACEHLSHDDPQVRGIVLETLSRFAETADLSGIALCTTDVQMGEVEDKFLAYVVDRSRLFFREEVDKRRILRDCMHDGTTELWMGTVLPASTCMGNAAWDGIPELEADILNADSRMVSQTTREWLATVHSVLQGPGSGWEQREETTRRILALGDTNLGHRLKEDAGYRTIVLAILELHCTRGKKTMCDELKSGITSAVRSVILDQDATHTGEIQWWRCATYEKGLSTIEVGTYFTIAIQPDEITDEMIEAAMNRPSCDSWSLDRYPREEEQAPSN